LRAVFIDERDRLSMFGTQTNGKNDGIFGQTNQPVKSSIKGQLITKQLQASQRLAAGLADAFYNQQELDLGVVTRPSQAQKFFHGFRSGYTG
jgi:hypothetical protein